MTPLEFTQQQQQREYPFNGKEKRNTPFADGPQPCKYGCGGMYGTKNSLTAHQCQCKLRPDAPKKGGYGKRIVRLSVAERQQVVDVLTAKIFEEMGINDVNQLKYYKTIYTEIMSEIANNNL